ncbi:cucumisin-like [Cornus florida]|uniref:cucumisin-like n=1 Tax=Cornus florida TaxID=4283 RepID=UPI00289BBD80|nr:cucumisin-like [Cornus florida]
MASQMYAPSWLILISLTCALLISCIGASDGDQEEYIVYMGDRPKGHLSASFLHTRMLQEVVGSRASESLLYSYKRSFNGFVAKLTKEEKEKIASMKGVVSVFPNDKMELHTTKSWNFMGLRKGVTRRVDVESNIIIGVFDTGIWPESESFDDTGFGPPPSKWKGSCQSSANFTCNNKLIGAKYYFSSGGSLPEKEVLSPRDVDGHGTHTASTAAGSLVKGASLLGLGKGTARGGVPSARIAVYKICWSDYGCAHADILAAFDDAIADGVDIISLSVGGSAADYFQDSIPIGAFYAMKNGILVSNSAGNSGPRPGSVASNAPWFLSVAASTIDRKYTTIVKLGNNMSYEGISINTFKLDHQYPLVYAGDVPNTQADYDGTQSRYCMFDNSLDPTLVNGTIVLCDSMTSGEVQLGAGAKGTIMNNDGFQSFGRTFPLPASYLQENDGVSVREYINSTRNPTASIMKSKRTKDKLAPYVITFSSRGPNPITRDILKPDLTAPGVEILAAWTQAKTVTGREGDKRVVPYNIISGTSMSCPHATGVAAYVKSFNPGWSPAAIKSALMTTATPMSSVTNPDAEFAYGAGHIDPVKATKPGLVYDAGELDYVKFLCGQGYSDELLKYVTNSSCSQDNIGTVWDLNYPSFSLSFQSENPITRVFHRTVTNVGSPVSTYKAIVTVPEGLAILVEPNVLAFRSQGQKQSFVVTITATMDMDKNILSGSLVWDDGVYKVRSPIVAHSPIVEHSSS